MNKAQLMLIIFLVFFVAAIWLMAFSFSVIPAHFRDPLGVQTAPLE